jgi:hypothetical protein
MFTRQQYITGECTHEQYYAQFAKPFIVEFVGEHFGIDKLRAAYVKDAAFNSIPLGKWDMLAVMGWQACIEKDLRDAGDFPCLAGAVCILKQAARQAIA